MPAQLFEERVVLLSQEGIVKYNGRKYRVELGWLRYDKDDNTYYINLVYLIRERMVD